MPSASRAAALTDALIAELRACIDAGRFPGILFEDAMAFALSDGIVPRAGLPVASLLALDDWFQALERASTRVRTLP